MQQPALYEDFGSSPIGAVENDELDEVVDFLSADPAANLFMLSWIDNYGVSAPGRPDLFQFRAIRKGSRLAGVALLITDRLALLHADDVETAGALGEYHREAGYHLEHLVSRRRCVVPFWREFSRRPNLRARLVRDQELYVLHRETWLARHHEPPTCDLPGSIRRARPEDIHAIFWASARMHAEETLEDPLERNASHFRRHVEHRIDNGRTFAWFDTHRRLLFKADVSAQSPWGAQISGVYTPPALRGRGIATRAMYDVCDALFERGFPRVTLYVNRTNKPARRVYEKVGFDYHTDYQTVFVESASRR